MGWIGPALPVLLSNDTPLVSGPLSNEQLSWAGSMNSIGAIVGTFLTGFFSAAWGSKTATELLAYPVIAVWLLIHFGNSFEFLLCARFCVGLCGGGFQSSVVSYISEISNDDIRGRLGSLVPLARNTGTLIAYIAGALIKYEYQPYIFIVIPITFLMLVYFLPSTPQYYLRKRNFKASLSFIICLRRFD